MINPVDRKYNLKNLKYITHYMCDMEYFLFFGTLLGYYRDGNVLEQDDDVDIYVNINQREEIIKILNKSDFNIRIVNPYFLQGHRILGGINTYVDFYLYEDDPTKDYISERWNIDGNIHNPSCCLHTPKEMVFPIKWGNITDTPIKVPHDIDACCRYLYGENYKIPLKKEVEYISKVVNHQPIIHMIKS